MPAALPPHLARFAVDQAWEAYSPRDHAVWRHVLRRLVPHLAGRAHESYLRGLAATGIGTERIPRVEEMDALLGRLGWSAVAVRGFLPPAVFTELQSRRVLAIAADVRDHEHVDYTPAPDVIHESAGHAPILVDPRYAEYVRRCGEVGFRAIPGAADAEVFEAVRALSVAKEDPGATEGERRLAEERLAAAAAAAEPASEGARASRLYWWTAEYGLVGDLDRPRIYGAGLLSSLGESARCLGPGVERLPLDARCAEVPYDITRMQPRLFVTPDFEALFDVLEDFARGLSFRAGGERGLAEAERAGTVVHLGLDGAEVSGPGVRRVAGAGTATAAVVVGPPAMVSRGGAAGAFAADRPAVVALGAAPPGAPGPFRLEAAGGAVLEGLHAGGGGVEALRGRAGSRELDLPRRALLVAAGRVASVAGGPADPGAWEARTGRGSPFAAGEGEARARARKGASLPPAAARAYEAVREAREAAAAGRPAGPGPIEALRRIAAAHPGEWLLAAEVEELARGGAPGGEGEGGAGAGGYADEPAPRLRRWRASPRS